MRMIALLLAGLAAAIAAAPAEATIRITADPGGLILSYAERFERARASGEPVVIDGPCMSACTLVVAMVPQGQLCATPRAVLGFHAAWRPDGTGGKLASPEATKVLYELYPAGLRAWIDRHGGLSRRVLLLHGRELGAYVPSCANGAVAGAARRHDARRFRRSLSPRAVAAQPR
jgi:hypothetical protein